MGSSKFGGGAAKVSDGPWQNLVAPPVLGCVFFVFGSSSTKIQWLRISGAHPWLPLVLRGNAWRFFSAFPMTKASTLGFH